MGMINVVNRYAHNYPVGAINVSIMRPSLLGNPSRIGPDGDRAKVIVKFTEHVVNWCLDDATRRKVLETLAVAAFNGIEVNLVCCCKPQACHGDVIREFLENLVEGMAGAEEC